MPAACNAFQLQQQLVHDSSCVVVTGGNETAPRCSGRAAGTGAQHVQVGCKLSTSVFIHEHMHHTNKHSHCTVTSTTSGQASVSGSDGISTSTDMCAIIVILVLTCAACLGG
jgi:hypothetical protein